MVFHDGTPSEQVARETAAVIREAARMIGKADRRIHNSDIHVLQLAIVELENILNLKSRINAT